MGDWLEECESCSSTDIVRKPPLFSSRSTGKVEQEKKVGEVTKEFIENARDDLKTQKKELDKKR